uniref:Uncharacterized protein n=1 Tax=Podoviridae sp. ctG4L18 TaxID=2825234 RepID=A0A8S5UNU9_9CAUD|nr:MAG TPA: hypothetical protein [Podoviridae sp. ctG4L18]
MRKQKDLLTSELSEPHRRLHQKCRRKRNR